MSKTRHVINGWTSLMVKRTIRIVSASLSKITEYLISGDTISIFWTKSLCTRSKMPLFGLSAQITISFTSVSPLSKSPLASKPTLMTPFKNRASSFWPSPIWSLLKLCGSLLASFGSCFNCWFTVSSCDNWSDTSRSPFSVLDTISWIAFICKIRVKLKFFFL